MKHAIELIEWADHASCHGPRGWREIVDAEELQPIIVISVGWVIKETEDFVVLVSQNGGDQIDGEICIIKSCIKRRVVLLKDES